MRTTSTAEENFCPLGGVGLRFAREFARRHPHVLVVRHPATRAWQLYYSPLSWTARRLVEAIRNERAVRDRIAARKLAGQVDPEEARRWRRVFWWRDHGAAPRIFEDDLPTPPGPWMFGWLAAAADRPAREYLREIEEGNADRRRIRREEVSDLHYGIADVVERRIRHALPAGISVTDAMKAVRRAESRAEIVY